MGDWLIMGSVRFHCIIGTTIRLDMTIHPPPDNLSINLIFPAYFHNWPICYSLIYLVITLWSEYAACDCYVNLNIGIKDLYFANSVAPFPAKYQLYIHFRAMKWSAPQKTTYGKYCFFQSEIIHPLSIIIFLQNFYKARYFK